MQAHGYQNEISSQSLVTLAKIRQQKPMSKHLPENSFVSQLAKRGDTIAAIGVIVVITLIVIPLPPHLLDVLLTFNIAFSLIIILVSMYTLKPLDFSVFPSLLLVVTLFRLGLNVSTTRLILLKAYAGDVILAFGNFVVGGNYVVGIVIFLVIVVIQFVVITKGATRIAEVAARFTLDAMPGKQMAIDADLNAGLIDDEEARKRRMEIAREANFYGAMDGASKFVRGDAIAGIIITTINILGGLVIGVLQRGMPLPTALHTYTLLTVGDGLVAQIPALVVSTAAGIIVTRAAAEADMGADIVKQLLVQPKPIALVAITLLFVGLVPGLPMVPFFILSAAAGGIAYFSRQAQRRSEELPPPEADLQPPKGGIEDIKQLLHIDPMELEIGYGLIPLVDKEQGGDLLDRVSMIRRRSALELGIIVPPIRIRDNVALEPDSYLIKIKGTEVTKGKLRGGALLAMNPGLAKGEIEGTPTSEPVFGLPAYWIEPSQKGKAERMGYTVVEPPAVVATHLSEVIRSHADELLGRQDVQNLVDGIKESHPAVVEELIPKVMGIGGVQKVLQRLLKERISIRDLVTILETLADYGPMVRDIDQLTEYVRQSLSRSICKQFSDEQGEIKCLTLDPKLEQILSDSIKRSETGATLALEPGIVRKLFDSISAKLEKFAPINQQPVILCPASIRVHLRRLMEGILPNLVVLSYKEIAPSIKVNSIGMIGLEDES